MSDLAVFWRKPLAVAAPWRNEGDDGGAVLFERLLPVLPLYELDFRALREYSGRGDGGKSEQYCRRLHPGGEPGEWGEVKRNVALETRLTTPVPMKPVSAQLEWILSLTTVCLSPAFIFAAAVVVPGALLSIQCRPLTRSATLNPHCACLSVDVTSALRQTFHPAQCYDRWSALPRVAETSSVLIKMVSSPWRIHR